MNNAVYVLVTPVRNEAATIEITIRSVLAQTLPPRQWVIVSNGSTDETDSIVTRFSALSPDIRLLRLPGPREHSFAAVVHAVQSGIKALTIANYDYVGLLDADVQFPPDYYEGLIAEFHKDAKLGLAGGLVVDVDPKTGKRRTGVWSPNEIAGATQFFRRECFESMNGLYPIPEGGWDTITGLCARMNGYRTRCFPERIMEHLKPRNSAFGNPMRRKWQMGLRDYALASHPLFEIAKCSSRLTERPFIVGAAARLAGFFWSGIARRKRILPSDLRTRMREEQMRKLLGVLHWRS